jgi:hypothetical protein
MKEIQIKGQVLFRGEIIVKMGWGHFKIFFSKTTGPILTRLGTNHPWVGDLRLLKQRG